MRLNPELGRWRWSVRSASVSAIAATVAWWLTVHATANGSPVFASVTTVVALAPGVANPRLQITGFLIGIGIGLTVGEAALPLVASAPVLIVGPLVFLSMVLGACLGHNPLILIQAGASALLVIGSANADVGRSQLLGALVGGGVAIAFSQFFFAPDAVARLRSAARQLVDASESLFSSNRRASDPRWRRVEACSVRFEQTVALAEGVRRWTLRGRLAAERIRWAERRWRDPVRRMSALAHLACVAPSAAVFDDLRRAITAVRDLIHDEAVKGRDRSCGTEVLDHKPS